MSIDKYRFNQKNLNPSKQSNWLWGWWRHHIFYKIIFCKFHTWELCRKPQQWAKTNCSNSNNNKLQWVQLKELNGFGDVSDNPSSVRLMLLSTLNCKQRSATEQQQCCRLTCNVVKLENITCVVVKLEKKMWFIFSQSLEILPSFWESKSVRAALEFLYSNPITSGMWELSLIRK